MNSTGYHFIHAGREVWAATKREIRDLARAIANKTGKPVKVNAGRRKVRANPTTKTLRRNPSPSRYEVVRDVHARPPGAAYRGEWYVMKGERIAAGPFDTKTAAQRWAGQFQRNPAGQARTMRANPDPGSFIPVWVEQEKNRSRRLAYNQATKARRLAKGLYGRDRGGKVKAGERQAEKTGKFAVDVQGRINGVQQKITLYRASRRAAQDAADGFAAAGARVSIREV